MGVSLEITVFIWRDLDISLVFAFLNHTILSDKKGWCRMLQMSIQSMSRSFRTHPLTTVSVTFVFGNT